MQRWECSGGVYQWHNVIPSFDLAPVIVERASLVSSNEVPLPMHCPIDTHTKNKTWCSLFAIQVKVKKHLSRHRPAIVAYRIVCMSIGGYFMLYDYLI